MAYREIGEVGEERELGLAPGGHVLRPGEKELDPPPAESATDFDFALGRRKQRSRFRLHPFEPSDWLDLVGEVSTRRVWGGAASLEEVLVEGGGMRVEGLTLRLYRPQARQWGLYWATSSSGVMLSPSVGRFQGDRGEFYDQDVVDGRSCFVRQSYTDVGGVSHGFEQALSLDGGKSWTPSAISRFDPVGPSLDERADLLAEGRPSTDFDFHFGRWKTHVSRRVRPLSPDDRWAEYDGTSNVTPIWRGKASLFELDVAGPEGHIEGAGVRLFNPETHLWSLNWASRRDGVVNLPPMVGSFRAGRGEFYDREIYDGRAIFCRNAFCEITASSCRFEQAFSEDGGKTWQENWLMSFVRLADGPSRI